MSSIRDSYSFVDYVVPKEVIEWVREQNEYETYQTIFNYCVKAIQMAYIAYSRGKAKAFDPNPGDAQCQWRGYMVYHFFQNEEIAENFQSLAKEAQTINKWMCSKRKLTQAEFFNTYFVPLRVNRDVAYLMGCFIAATVRVFHHREENGVVVTQTNVGRLSVFARDLNTKFTSEHRKEIVDHVKGQVCLQTLDYIQKEIDKIGATFMCEKPLLQKMCSARQIRYYADQEIFQKRPFFCQFFSLQGSIFRCSEKQMLIAFKSIEEEGKPFYLFYRSPNPGGFLEPISEKAVHQMPPSQPILIYEGVSKLAKEVLAEKIDKVGFATVLLTQAAHLSPFHSKSTVNEVENFEARQTILAYQLFAQSVGRIVDFDHIYANTLGKELPGSLH